MPPRISPQTLERAKPLSSRSWSKARRPTAASTNGRRLALDGIADAEARAEIGVVELAPVGDAAADESHVLVEFMVGEGGELCAEPPETLLDAKRRVELVDARTLRRRGGRVRIVEASEEARIAAVEIERGERSTDCSGALPRTSAVRSSNSLRS